MFIGISFFHGGRMPCAQTNRIDANISWNAVICSQICNAIAVWKHNGKFWSEHNRQENSSGVTYGLNSRQQNVSTTRAPEIVTSTFIGIKISSPHNNDGNFDGGDGGCPAVVDDDDDMIDETSDTKTDWGCKLG